MPVGIGNGNGIVGPPPVGMGHGGWLPVGNGQGGKAPVGKAPVGKGGIPLGKPGGCGKGAAAARAANAAMRARMLRGMLELCC